VLFRLAFFPLVPTLLIGSLATCSDSVVNSTTNIEQVNGNEIELVCSTPRGLTTVDTVLSAGESASIKTDLGPSLARKASKPAFLRSSLGMLNLLRPATTHVGTAEVRGVPMEATCSRWTNHGKPKLAADLLGKDVRRGCAGVPTKRTVKASLISKLTNAILCC